MLHTPVLVLNGRLASSLLLLHGRRGARHTSPHWVSPLYGTGALHTRATAWRLSRDSAHGLTLFHCQKCTGALPARAQESVRPACLCERLTPQCVPQSQRRQHTGLPSPHARRTSLRHISTLPAERRGSAEQAAFPTTPVPAPMGWLDGPAPPPCPTHSSSRRQLARGRRSRRQQTGRRSVQRGDNDPVPAALTLIEHLDLRAKDPFRYMCTASKRARLSNAQTQAPLAPMHAFSPRPALAAGAQGPP